MVEIFGSMGFLKDKDSPKGDPGIPPKLLVATFGPGIKFRGSE